MRKYIVIPSENVEFIKGTYGDIPSILEPIEYENIWIVPIDVLDDIEFKSIYKWLRVFSIIELDF